ncbi:MAG: response regulator transcription factor [Syntrophaceae bacterium]|nr:response regulator transcription factor [Syntrophaceae bacterium]
MTANIKVLIVDDHAIVREGLKALIEFEDDMIFLGEAASGMECLELLEKCCPNVILLDLKMPGIDGIHTATLIKSKYPYVKTVLLTNYDDEEYVTKALKSGVDGYVLKNICKGDVVRIIRHVFSGKSYIDQSITHTLFNQFRDNTPTAEDAITGKSLGTMPTLTQRELQVLELIVEGKSSKQIANDIYLSMNTVKVHLRNIYRKLGVNTRSQAIKIAIQTGIVHLNVYKSVKSKTF